MKPKISIITLGVNDLEESLKFYRDGLGWQTKGIMATEFKGDDKQAAGAILGCDLAGEIAAVGANVTKLKVGDPVFAMMPHDWGAQPRRCRPWR